MIYRFSPATDSFTFFRLIHLLNKRFLEKLKEEWWNSEPYKRKCTKPADQSEGISIENIGGVFIVIFVGVVLSCISLGYEYCVYKGCKPSKIMNVAEGTSNKMGISSNPNNTFGRRVGKDSSQKSMKLRRRNTSLPNHLLTKYGNTESRHQWKL